VNIVKRYLIMMVMNHCGLLCFSKTVNYILNLSNLMLNVY